jgi:hypothetical protein
VTFLTISALGSTGQSFAGPASMALLVHTLGYPLVTGLIAVVVYEKLGLDIPRKS